MDIDKLIPWNWFNHYAELQEKFKSTADIHEKNVLRKRLKNLQRVKQFLVSVRTGNTIEPVNPHYRPAWCFGQHDQDFHVSDAPNLLRKENIHAELCEK